MDRREFVAGGMAVAAAHTPPALSTTGEIKAIAFDGLALFDPRPIFALAEQLFPGKGAPLVATWRARQFEYTWLRTIVGSYVDFLQITDEALSFAVEAEKVSLTTEHRRQLLAGFMDMKAWPDVVPVLKALKKKGVGLAPLTNFTLSMLEVAIRNSDLGGVFDHLLSTDLVKAYKPDPRSYQMALDAFGLRREQIAFVAFGGWDAAGAKTFGYPTIWINRLNTPTERLGVLPDQIASNFEALPAFVGR